MQNQKKFSLKFPCFWHFDPRKKYIFFWSEKSTLYSANQTISLSCGPVEFHFFNEAYVTCGMQRATTLYCLLQKTHKVFYTWGTSGSNWPKNTLTVVDGVQKAICREIKGKAWFDKR